MPLQVKVSMAGIPARILRPHRQAQCQTKAILSLQAFGFAGNPLSEAFAIFEAETVSSFLVITSSAPLIFAATAEAESSAIKLPVASFRTKKYKPAYSSLLS